MSTSRIAATCLALPILVAALRGADTPRLPTETLLVAGYVFELDLAVTPEDRERGLMDRDHLPPDRGMLFVFADLAPRQFWMKNTRVDLDIIYADDSGRIVSIVSMRREAPRGERETEAQYEGRLPLYSSVAPARFAVELPSGSLSLLNLAVGDRLDLDVDRLRALAR